MNNSVFAFCAAFMLPLVDAEFLEMKQGQVIVVPQGEPPLGCLSSSGTWQMGNDCGTFNFSRSGDEVMMYSNGEDCGVKLYHFVCPTSDAPAPFGLDNRRLTYQNETLWSAYSYPKYLSSGQLLDANTQGKILVELVVNVVL